MIRSRHFLPYVFILLVFTACKLDKPCLPPQAEIGTVRSVFAGQTLELRAASVAGATYSWTGPNNFFSSEPNPAIPNVTAGASGTYQLTVKVSECENKTSAEIEILPGASCSPTNNTISLLSKMTFTAIVGQDNTEEYQIVGHSDQGDCMLTFYTNPFKKGNFIYEFSTQNRNANNVLLDVGISYAVLADWQPISGKLYVAVSNGVLTATFCSVTFSCMQGPYTKTGSGKITCIQ